MTIAAKVTPTELVDQVTDRFVDNYFIVKLLNANGLVYTPGIQDETQFVLDNELTPNTNGYKPQIFGYTSQDVGNYADAGVGLLQKQAIFSHDGSNSDFTFDHCSIQWATGVALTASADPAVLPPLIDGVYDNLPVTALNSLGTDLTVNLTVDNTQETNEAKYAITISTRGYNYSPADILEVSAATLSAVGASDGTPAALGIILTEVYQPTNANAVFAIAPTDGAVTLANGNESAFYFNLRQFGYYNTAATEVTG